MKIIQSFEKINLFTIWCLFLILPYYTVIKSGKIPIALFLLGIMYFLMILKFISGDKIIMPKTFFPLLFFTVIYFFFGIFIYLTDNKISLKVFSIFIPILFLFIIPNIIKERKDLFISISIFFYSAVSLSVLMLLEYLSIIHLNFIKIYYYSAGIKRFYGIGESPNPNSFSILFFIALLCGFYLLAARKIKTRNWLYILGEMFLIIAMLLLQSRALIYSSVISVIITFLLFGKATKIRYLIFIFLLLIFVFFLFIKLSGLQRVLSTESSNRVARWSAGMKIFLDHPIFGVGQKRAKNLIDRELYRERKYSTANYIEAPKNLHNFYLQTLVSSGLIGFIVLLVLIISVFYFALFTIKKRNNSILLLLSILTLIFFNITHSMFFIYYFWIFFGFFEAENNINKYIFQGGIHEKI